MCGRGTLFPVVCISMLAPQLGCQAQPRTILPSLPVYSILSAESLRRRPARPRVPAAEHVPRSWIPPVADRPWRWIVIHHSATDRGSAESFDRMHRARGWDELGYHFVITNGRGAGDGQVEVGSRWRKQKWGAHCGGTPNNNYNNYGIGICLVGDFTSSLPSRAQTDSLRRLVAFLARRYRIAPDCVIGHRHAPNASTACPGERLDRYLTEKLRPGLYFHWRGARKN